MRALLREIYYWGPRKCPACGKHARLRFSNVMWPELGEQWDLTPDLYRQFDQREGMSCTLCGNNLRARQLASVVVDRLNGRLVTHHSSLRALCQDPKAADLRVAEINSLGALHAFLQRLPKLHYSEFGSPLPEIPSEDLSALSYEDATFDLVLTSDTLEHVPQLDAALGEIRRVLKPGGLHIFTVPLIWDRASRARASKQGEEIVHHHPPSFHGDPASESADFLVFNEFGWDFLRTVEGAGFDVSFVKDAGNPTLTTFIARRNDPPPPQKVN